MCDTFPKFIYTSVLMATNTPVNVNIFLPILL